MAINPLQEELTNLPTTLPANWRYPGTCSYAEFTSLLPNNPKPSALRLHQLDQRKNYSDGLSMSPAYSFVSSHNSNGRLYENDCRTTPADFLAMVPRCAVDPNIALSSRVPIYETYPSHNQSTSMHIDEPIDAHRLPQPPTLASHGRLYGQYADFSVPPDLYPNLHEEPTPPPHEDMNPSERDMVPYEREVRFDGDLYTPKFVRRHGAKREGWCGVCKPGRWLVLKNSAYWYHMSCTHGISAATGAPFHTPLEKRHLAGNNYAWEGLCGSCNKWVALGTTRRKLWFRHAYKCHTYIKSKCTPKRSRGNSQARLSNSNLSFVTTQGKRGADSAEKQEALLVF